MFTKNTHRGDEVAVVELGHSGGDILADLDASTRRRVGSKLLDVRGRGCVRKAGKEGEGRQLRRSSEEPAVY